MKSFALTAALISALPLFASATTVAEKVVAFRNAPNAVAAIGTLEDGDFKFDFKNPELKKVTGAGGELVSANIGNFAALVGNGLALTIGHMEACGINSPHTHPRATEVLLVLNGEVSAGFLTENGSRFVVNNVTEYQAMVFPAGSIHFQANYGCEPVKFVAALSNEDPGTLQVAQRFFALSADVVGASLGGLGVQQVEDLASKIPDNMIAGAKECYQRCGIPYPENQPTKQQQPKPSGTQPATQPPPSSAPAQPPTSVPAPPPPAPSVVDVYVGKDGAIAYDNVDISAPVGSTVRFHFLTKNHTVTESSFDTPCEPKPYGFNSGFQPVAPGAAEKTFDVQVKDDKPIWFYCAQRPAGAPKGHCALGMNGGINAPKDGEKSLAAFQKLAENSK